MALPNEPKNKLYGTSAMKAKVLPASLTGPIPTFTRFMERPSGDPGSLVTRLKRVINQAQNTGVQLTGKEYIGVIAGRDPEHGIVDLFSHPEGSAILRRYNKTLAAKNITPAQAVRGSGLEIMAGGRSGIIEFPNLVSGSRMGPGGQILSNSSRFVSKKAFYDGRLYDAAELTEVVIKRAMQGELFDPATGMTKKINPALMQRGDRLARHINRHVAGVTRYLTHQAAESAHDVPKELRATGTYQDVIVGNVFVDMETKRKMKSFNDLVRSGDYSVGEVFGEGGVGFKWLEEQQKHLSSQLNLPVSFHTQKIAALAAGEWSIGHGPQDFLTMGGLQKEAGTARQQHRVFALQSEKVKAFRHVLGESLKRRPTEFLMAQGPTTMTAAMEAAIEKSGGKIYQQNIRMAFLLDKKGADVLGGSMESVLASPELLDLISQDLGQGALELGRPGQGLWLQGQKANVAAELDRGFVIPANAIHTKTVRGWGRVKRGLTAGQMTSREYLKPHIVARLKTGDPANLLGIMENLYVEAAYNKLSDRRMRRVFGKYAGMTGREVRAHGQPRRMGMFAGRKRYSFMVPNMSPTGQILQSEVPVDARQWTRALKYLEGEIGVSLKDFIVEDPDLGRILPVIAPLSVRDIPATRDVAFTKGDISQGSRHFFRAKGGLKLTLDEPAMARILGRTQLADYYEGILRLSNRSTLVSEIARPLEARLGVKLGGDVPTMSVEQMQIRYGKDLDIWRKQIQQLRTQGMKSTVLTEEIAKTQLFQDLIEGGFYLEAGQYGKLAPQRTYVPRIGLEHELKIGEVSEELKRVAKLLTPSDLPIHVRMSKFEEEWFAAVIGKGGLAQRFMEPRIGGTFRGTMQVLGGGSPAAAWARQFPETGVFLEKAERYIQKRARIEIGSRKAKLAKLEGFIREGDYKDLVKSASGEAATLRSEIKSMSEAFESGTAVRNLRDIAQKRAVGEMEDIVVLSKKHLKNLTKEQELFYHQHGYVPSMLRRYPVTSSGGVIPVKAIFAPEVGGEVIHMAQHNALRMFGDFDLDKALVEFLQGEKGARAFEQAYELDRSMSAAAQRISQYITDQELKGIPELIKQGDLEAVVSKSLGRWQTKMGPKGLAGGAALAAAAQQTHIGTAHSIVNKLGYFYLADAISSQEARRTGMTLEQLARQEQMTRGFVQQLMISYKAAQDVGLPNMDVFNAMTSAMTKGKIEREEFSAVFGQVIDQMEKGGPIIYPEFSIPELRQAHASKAILSGTAKDLTRAQQAIEDTYRDFNKGISAHLKYLRDEHRLAPETLKLLQEIKGGLQTVTDNPLEQQERAASALRQLLINNELLEGVEAGTPVVIEGGRSGASGSGVAAVNRAVQDAGREGFREGGPVERRMGSALEEGMRLIKKHPVGAALAGAALAGAAYGMLGSGSSPEELSEAAMQQMMKDPRMRGGMMDLNAARQTADGEAAVQFVPQDRVFKGPDVRNRVFQQGTIESFPDAKSRPDGIMVNGRVPTAFEMAGISDSIDSSLYT